MPTFSYTAVDGNGQQTSGTLEAASQEAAAEQLRAKGWYPTGITQMAAKSAASQKMQKGTRAFSEKKVNAKSLTVFTRQLATLIDAGLPLLKGLNTLNRQEKHPTLKYAIAKMGESVESGSTFSEAIAAHPKIFSKLYVNMVKAGELGGVLEIVLARLAEFMEKAQRIKNKVVAAMFYPIIVLIIAVVILAFLLIFVVPQFKQIFKEMLGDKPLPPITVFVTDLSTFLLNNILYIIGAVVVIVVSFNLYKRTDGGRRNIDKLTLKIPLFGNLILLTGIARFCRTLGTLITSGVPILQALNITKETAGNTVLADAVAKVHDAVKEGENMAGPLEQSGVFPPMVVSMIDIGEETGRLPDMLIRVADVYEDEVDNAVAGITSILEPVMIVFLAVVVGTIVIALFLPLISIITELGNM
jgi:type IV pilus assembly protein PilC